MLISVTCPKCRANCVVDDQNKGKTIRCGHCKGLFTLPGAPAKTKPKPAPQARSKPTPAAAKISVNCPKCRTKCVVGAENRGKQVRCGKCKGLFGIPATRPSGIKPAAKQPVRPAAKRTSGIQAKRPQPARSAANMRTPASVMRRPRKKSGGMLTGMLIGLTMALVLVIGVVGAGGYFLYVHRAQETKTDHVAQTKPPQTKPPQTKPPVQQPKTQIPPIKKTPVSNPPNPEPPAKKPPVNQPPVKQPPKQPPVKQQPPKQNPPPKQPPSNPPPRNGSITREALAKVKEATLYLHVKLKNGEVAQGSGFFGQEPGIILTNAHVLGMLEEWSERPVSVEAVYRSGLQGERTFKAEILGVDRGSDLAVLRVRDANLPPPLTIRSSKDLIETQTVYVVGYPLGDLVGKNVTISQTSISSLRDFDQDGVFDQVQTNGGMHPGNSGGPVINTNGEVIGLAVAVIKGTTINFAIPSDIAQSVFKGRLAKVNFAPVKTAKNLRVDVDIELIDPLERVKELSVVFWTGKADTPGKLPKDEIILPGGQSKWKKLTLNPRQLPIKGHLLLPELQTGDVYWYQTLESYHSGEQSWSAVKTYQPKFGTEAVAGLQTIPGLKTEPSQLTLQYVNVQRLLKMKSKQIVKLRATGEENFDFDINMETTMLERPAGYDNNTGLSATRLEYRKYAVGMPTKLMTPRVKSRLGVVVRNIGKLAANLMIDRTGKLVKNEVDVRQVPFEYRDDLMDLHSQIQDSLEALELPMPNRLVNPNETWTAVRKINFAGSSSGALMAALRLTYRYLGVVERDGRKEGVIHIHGDVISRPGVKALKIGGKASGLAYFDLQKGQLTDAEVTASTQVELKMGGQEMKADMTLVSSLERLFFDIPPKTPTQMPGSKQILNVAGNLRNNSQQAHKVKLQAKQTYTINLESHTIDPALELRTAAGQMIKSNDDRGAKDRNSRIVFTAPSDGEYVVVAKNFKTGNGPYRLIVRQDTGVGTIDLNINNILPPGQLAINTVELKAGVAYTIDLRSTAFDPVLILQDATGKALRQDDDGGGFPNSRIIFTAPQTGTYRLIARSFNRRQGGPYQLTVRH